MYIRISIRDRYQWLNGCLWYSLKRSPLIVEDRFTFTIIFFIGLPDFDCSIITTSDQAFATRIEITCPNSWFMGFCSDREYRHCETNNSRTYLNCMHMSNHHCLQQTFLLYHHNYTRLRPDWTISFYCNKNHKVILTSFCGCHFRCLTSWVWVVKTAAQAKSFSSSLSASNHQWNHSIGEKKEYCLHSQIQTLLSRPQVAR